jgi:hypothetical protein
MYLPTLEDGHGLVAYWQRKFCRRPQGGSLLIGPPGLPQAGVGAWNPEGRCYPRDLVRSH